MGWIGCVPCKKFKCDIVARTFVLIAPIQYVLQQVSCSYETIPNGPKYYETDRNISSGPNGVDGVRWFQKITMWLRGTNFWINCTSSHRFTPSFMQLRNDNRWTQTLWNLPKHEFRANGVNWVRSLRKIRTWLRGLNFCIKIAPVHPILHRVSWSYETIPNAPKHYTTHQNISLGSNGAD